MRQEIFCREGGGHPFAALGAQIARLLWLERRGRFKLAELLLRLAADRAGTTRNFLRFVGY